MHYNIMNKFMYIYIYINIYIYIYREREREIPPYESSSPRSSGPRSPPCIIIIVIIMFINYVSSLRRHFQKQQTNV